MDIGDKTRSVVGSGWVLALLSALACSACTPALAVGTVDVFADIGRIGVEDLVHGRGPTCDEQCTDREYADHYSAKELAALAIWRAGRGNCTCGYALLNACGMKDLTVREAALRDHALRACVEDVSPAKRRELRITSTAPGTIAACIGDE
jgi:hypothetical protein